MKASRWTNCPCTYASMQRAAAVVSTLLPPPRFSCAVPVAVAAAATVPKPKNCTQSCGNISIFYPFGVEPGCYHAAGFNLTCNRQDGRPKLFLGDGNVQVLDIFLSNSTVRINSSSMVLVNDGVDGRTLNTTRGVGFPYYLSERTNNMLHAQGCNIQVDLRGGVQNNLIGSCTAMCSSPYDGRDQYNSYYSSSCTGIGRCQTGIILGYSRYNIQIHYLFQNLSSPRTSSIYIVDEEEEQIMPQSYSVLPTATLEWGNQ